MIAVKPKDVAELLAAIKQHLKAEHVIISVAAAITTEFIEKAWGRK